MGKDTKTTQRRLLRMLEEAHNAILSELSAAGEDEVEQNPILRAKLKLIQRHDIALKKLGLR